MTKTQIGAYLSTLFSTVNGLPALMFFPRVKALIVKIQTAVNAGETAIFAALPETFTVANVIDTLFAWAKKEWPSEQTALEVLQFVVDGVLAAAPSL